MLGGARSQVVNGGPRLAWSVCSCARHLCSGDGPHPFMVFSSEGEVRFDFSRCGPCEFAEALWRYDVAELFIKDAHSDRYLEFNLAPNGAWWSAEFVGPRVRACTEDIPIVGVKTYSKTSADGYWQAAASIPLSFLKSDFSFGQGSRVNVTFIVDSPEQKFLSIAALPGAKPDFHQPEYFKEVELIG